MSKPMVVGLTGGIGTGKSTVSRLFREMGAVVIDADQTARAVVAKGTAGLAAIAAEFGPGVLTPEGELDRQAMARRIFAEPADRRRLEAIVHPRIFEHMQGALAKALLEQAAPVIILDVPLLFESGRYLGLVDKTLVVYTDSATQLARVMARDGLSEQDAARRIQAQGSLADKVRRADYTIDNNGPHDSTRAQVAALWNTWCAMVAQKCSGHEPKGT